MNTDGLPTFFSLILSLLVAALMTHSAGVHAPAEAAMEGEFTGNASIVSKYIFRGGVEDDDGAIQGGLDYSHPSGFYAGYWGSSLDYSSGGSTNTTSFENDLYLGMTGDLSSKLSYDVGLLQYLYTNDNTVGRGEDGDATDLYVTLSRGPFSVGAAYALADASWTNSGDIYYHASYSTDISHGFSLGAKIGYYDFHRDAGNLMTTENGTFRDAVITLSHPIGETGATWQLQYVQSGETRMGTDLADDQQVVIGINYGFDATKLVSE